MSRTRLASVRELLAQGMTPFERRLHGRLIDETMRLFAAFQRSKLAQTEVVGGLIGRRLGIRRKKWNGIERRQADNAAARQVIEFLSQQIQLQIRGLNVLAARHVEFRRSAARTANRDELGHLLLDYAAELGTTWKQRWSDRRAVRRWLDEEALSDRYRQRLGEQELSLIFLLHRFGYLAALLARQIKRTGDVVELWERLRIDQLVRAVLEYGGDRRVRVAATRCLAQALEPIPPTTASLLVSQENTSRIHRMATDPTADVWLQCAALDVLSKIDDELFPKLLMQRLVRPQPGDDLFVRRHCLRQSVRLTPRLVDCDRLWERVLDDPSPAVRQQLASTLWQYPGQAAWRRLVELIVRDPSNQVRAAAICGSLEAIERPEFHSPFLRLLAEQIVAETDTFCQRVAMHVAVDWLRRWSDRSHDARFSTQIRDIYQQHLMPAIGRVASESVDVPTRRWAAAAAERVWVQLDSVAGPLYARLAARIQFLRRGQMCQIPASWVRDVDGNTLGRILAVMTQDDFGIEVTRGAFGYTVRRQPQFGFRCWRAWHEFWRPATDKRQAHSHTIGRISQGTIRAPSRIMGELSATKVPGEPLVIAADGTWRPFLPLVDDFVSALNQSVILPRTTRLYSSEGVTEIEVSRNPFRRLAAALRLIVRFNDYAELRNWTPSLQQRPDKYLQTMQRAGFRVRFRPHGDRPSDSTVTQFFPALLALGAANWWPVANDVVQQYAFYFGSAFQNTLTQLVAFTAIALVLFLARHGLSNFRIRRARRQIPLAIGGWGTRGKSGTERLKAALVNATGHGLVSKTTGCEAMFIHAPPCGEPLEIPLYRPGDKATIWEQSNLLRIAATMRPSAFLWECMALTPDYVHLLQHQWMHDDLATITNTYPDHEDIQGPAGIDVASTITVFVPRRARLLSTEQQMFPLLRERCARLATSVRCVTWLESGLITDDLLDRFPYREHPDNIALVAAVAEELGCSRDFALKAMADHLVPDLGVLKTHPRSRVEDCSLEFTNGMSANERFGCLGNWKRLGFDHHDPRQEPTTFLSTVVNNRADRVARSRVFASVLVNDLQADRHFLIGGNLEGLQGFIWEAWDAYERSVALRREGGQWDGAYALELLQRLAKRFRIPTTDQQLQSSLQAMLTAVAADNDERTIGLADQLLLAPEQCTTRLMALGVTESATARVTRHWEQLVEGRRELIELNKFISAARTADHFAQAEARLRQTIKHWFARKLIVIENYDATGEEIIRQIVDHTPPGFLNRVMGIQNIKGTGLDFVYRFHAWDTCHQACQMLKSSDPAKRATALTMLQTLPEYGLLCQSLLQSTCEQLRHASPPLPPAAQVQLEAICRKLDENIQASRERQERPVRGERNDGPAALSSHPWLSWVLNTLEQWREVNDAVRRRHQADQIYRDLQHQRIGRQRAVQELRHLNRRQKGGWLAGRLLNRRP